MGGILPRSESKIIRLNPHRSAPGDGCASLVMGSLQLTRNARPHWLTVTEIGRSFVILHTINVRVAPAARRSFHFLPKKGVLPMYTRVVELTTKPGKARELCTTVDEKVLPILQKQAGFVDEAVLASDTDSNRVLGISFWNSKDDAERYHREQYPKINEMLAHLLDTDPVIRTFEVHSSTTHKVVAGKAA